MSFLGLEGLHAFVTGAAGGIGSQAVREFLDQGCKVTAHDLRPITNLPTSPNLFIVIGDISSEDSTKSCIQQARQHHGPINILVANAGITDESNSYPIWKIPLELWEKTYNTNIRGTFLTIKHFLLSAEEVQISTGKELENLAIVVTGSETGKFGQAGHTEYASGKAGLQYGLVRGVKNEIVRLNSKARINAVAPGWVDTPLIEGRLDEPDELWTEAQATVPLRKIAKPEDVARAMVFLASHRAAGHISGECLGVDGGMEGRVVWKKEEVMSGTQSTITSRMMEKAQSIIQPSLSPPPTRKIKILLSIDFDAVSGFLGTGATANNNMADYSSGYFAGQVGVPRLLKLFKKHKISSNVTWFIPGHSMETFPTQTKMILESGAEIGCHGYAHEGGAQMTESQEKEVIAKCVELATSLTGSKPRGWRAPLYQIREHTVKVLEEHGFLYDTSLTHHDSEPYFLPSTPPIKPINFSPEVSATSWMKPLPVPSSPTGKTLVELPCNWYMEDMTPMQFLPAAPNSHGYVPTSSILSMWKSRFNFLYHEHDAAELKVGKGNFIFPLVLHPDTSGMAHVIGMIDEMIEWLKGWGGEVEFSRYEDVAREWREGQKL
ncbi:polysaccharide deacetylase family protein-like protein [Hyaloscypha bicolor E]|uniref:Polysaccharide deacetylase family protein-like protein n=1 Tax=Hyaloscypha bicolor E TaxID=1095630 RepID=A0A2J6TQX5_9HELO|nr:polysaccharide deacetylase family protein-like protein [Hyaloscypha bicolor E]PMD65348.1 polysaccharide deacetylase family protein-like protein [Hyaloscypha bicolor E]